MELQPNISLIYFAKVKCKKLSSGVKKKIIILVSQWPCKFANSQSQDKQKKLYSENSRNSEADRLYASTGSSGGSALAGVAGHSTCPRSFRAGLAGGALTPRGR